jgi:hypothetical protein
MDDEGRDAGFGGGLLRAVIDGSAFTGEDSDACAMGLNPFVLGREGADTAGGGGGRGAELDGGLKFDILFGDSESE